MPSKRDSVWTLQDAKNRFSEVVRDAVESGPQVVTRHGEDIVVIVGARDFAQLKSPPQSLLEFLRNSPLADVDLDLERSQDEMREIDLS